jgi:hypothetical protein
VESQLDVLFDLQPVQEERKKQFLFMLCVGTVWILKLATWIMHLAARRVGSRVEVGLPKLQIWDILALHVLLPNSPGEAK